MTPKGINKIAKLMSYLIGPVK